MRPLEVTGMEWPRGFQEVKVPRLHDMVVRLPVLRTSRLYPQEMLLIGTHFCKRLSRPQGHSAIGRITSMKNSNDTIWDRTSDLQICSAVP
jgi:hypothetical protein